MALTLQKYADNVRKISMAAIIRLAMARLAPEAQRQIEERIAATTTKRTGRLLDSVVVDADNAGRLAVSITAPYAQYLTDERDFMAPLREMSDELAPLIHEELERALHAGGAGGD